MNKNNGERKRSRTLSENERLLRLNVGGHPYDVVRTSLPLLETMMNDRWLSSCLVDGDGRVFLDRDGETFGDLLRYLRGGMFMCCRLARWMAVFAWCLSCCLLSSPSTGAEFLLGLVHGSGGRGCYQGGSASSFSDGGILTHHASSNMERLRRLRTEADYYGLHQLVHDIDVVTIGQKVLFECESWARVAGGWTPRNRRDTDVDAEAVVADADMMAEDEEVNDDEEGNDENEEADNDEQLDFDEGQDDPNREPLYKHWSWSKQYGNPDILRPHPTHSQMIVGQDGTYVMMLRFAAALPSPLARIKWDQDEEENRRVTRGALRRGRSRNANAGSRRRLDDSDEEEGAVEDCGGDNVASKEVEEDYFVTVNIEAPLQTVMDSIDESQTHFPLLRAGLWDYRTEEEVLNEDPVFATGTSCNMDAFFCVCLMYHLTQLLPCNHSLCHGCRIATSWRQTDSLIHE